MGQLMSQQDDGIAAGWLKSGCGDMGGLVKGTWPQRCSPRQQGGGKVPSSHPSWEAVTLLWHPQGTAEGLKRSTYGQRGLTETKLGETQLLCSLGWRSTRFLCWTWDPPQDPPGLLLEGRSWGRWHCLGPHNGQFSSPRCAQPCNKFPVRAAGV